MNTAATNAQPDGKVCNKSNNFDNGNYSGYSIHVINKDKRQADDKPADKQLTVFGPVSAMEKTTCLDSNDTIRIILTSSSGTHEIKITNVLNNKKPLIYDITDKPVDVRDLKSIISQNECDYSPLLINKINTTNVTNSTNPQNNNCTNILKTNTENDCKPILKNNETNDTTDIKNTSDSKDPSYLNESTHDQTVNMCKKNSTTNNNKNQTTETVTTTMVTQNNTELTNTTNTSGKINIITIENGNNGTITPDRSEKCTKDQQNDCSPAVTGSNEIPITKNTDKNQTQTIAENAVCSNGTHTDKNSEPDNAKNNTITTENKNNTTTSIPNNFQNSSNPISESNTTPVMKNDNNQSETNNTTTINNSPNVNANTTDSNTTNAYKKPEPNEAVTMETKNNTTTDPKNNQNSSNPVIEGTTVPITEGNNDRTETKNATATISAPNVTANTTDSNNTDAYKNHEPDHTDNDTVTTEIRDDTITDPNHTAVVTDNPQNDSNPVVESDEIPAITNTSDYQNPAETVNTTVSTSNYVENTTASNSRRTNDDTYTGSNETSAVVNFEETIQTPETTIASDADDVGPTEKPDTISQTKTGVNDDESTDVYDITTTGTTEPTQPTPIYNDVIKTPNNGSMTNNATKIVNIFVY